MKFRGKLQRFLQQETERTQTDFIKTEACLSLVEEFIVTVDLLKETKIGKVVRKLGGIELNAEFNQIYHITERCKALLVKWKALLPTEEPIKEEIHAHSEAIEEGLKEGAFEQSVGDAVVEPQTTEQDMTAQTA